MNMNEAIIKNKIIEYAENMLQPSLVEDANMQDSITDEHGTTNVWLIECDTGEEYFVLEGDMPSNIFKKSGIYTSSEQVYEAYLDVFEEGEKKEASIDRFTYL